MEEEDAIEGAGGEAIVDQDDERPRDLGFNEVALPEDPQDVLDPRTGGLSEDVIPADAVQVLRDGTGHIPVG
jgi:hypothetical protein